MVLSVQNRVNIDFCSSPVFLTLTRSPIRCVIGRNETEKLSVAFTIAKQEENAMPQIGIRITHELHGRIQDTADEQNISVSDFVRQSALHMLNGCQSPLNNSQHTKFNEHLERQVEEKDKQIQELHQLLAVSQKSVQQLTEQNQTLLIDNHTSSWWKRLLRR